MSEDKKRYTSMKVSVEVRDTIKGFGWKGETYDEILRRVFKALPNKIRRQLLTEAMKRYMVPEAAPRGHLGHARATDVHEGLTGNNVE